MESNKQSQEERIKVIMDQAESIQKDLHEFIDEAMKDPKAKSLTYDSLKDVFFMMKIAELEQQIKYLNSKGAVYGRR